MYFVAPHFVIFSTRTNTFWWKSLPSLVFILVILGTQLIALFLSVYGVGNNPNVAGIGWVRSVIILAISFATFFIMDAIKVTTIYLWEKIDKPTSQPSVPAFVKSKPTKESKASKFVQKQQRSRFGYDRAERRESVSSVKSY